MALEPNSTTEKPVFSQDSLDSMFEKFVLYFVEGSFLALTNLTVLFAIMTQRILRNKKEYVIIAGLSLADGMAGLALATAGFGRNLVILKGDANILVSRWDCAWAPWNVLLLYFENMGGLMLLVVSIDRLLAVSMPLKYFNFTKHYSQSLVGIVLIFQAFNAFAAYLLAYLYYQFPEKPSICYSSYSMSPKYYVYFTNLGIVSGLGSVVLYVFVIIIFSTKHKVSPSGAGSNAAAARHMKAQRRLTVTLGISCFFTIILYVIPISARWAAQSSGLGTETMAIIIPWMGILNNLNPMFNFFLYCKRHKDLKLAVKCLFKCKRITKAMLDRLGLEHSTTHKPASSRRVNDVEMKSL